MTYDPNDPVRHRVVRDREGMSGMAVAGILFAVLLLAGVLLYAFTGDRQVASTDRPSVTTGQGTETPRPGSPPQSNPGPSERAPATTPKAQ
jgi:hypothetical protein